MTLIELILVMALLGLLLGTGVGMLASLDIGDRAAVGLVQNVVRSARNSAVARAAPARVRFDAEESTVTAEAMEVIGTWHFEDTRFRGAFELPLAGTAVELVDDGFIGRAADFTAARVAWLEAPVRNLARFDLSGGFAIDCAVRWSGESGGKLVRMGDSAGITVSSTGAVRGWFVPEIVDENGRRAPGGVRAVDGEPGTLKPNRWMRLRVEYDRRLLRLLVDGVEVARAAEDPPVWKIESALYVSDPQTGFGGSIDNLVISAVTASEVVELPEGVRFGPDAPAEIRFDASGHLNRELHPEPVEFGLEFEDGRRTRMRVGLYGTVE